MSQKSKIVLELIVKSLGFGNLRYDKIWDGWVLTVCNRPGVSKILYKFTLYQLRTTKQKDVISLTKILTYLNLGYNKKDNPNRPELYKLLREFDNRLKD